MFVLLIFRAWIELANYRIILERIGIAAGASNHVKTSQDEERFSPELKAWGTVPHVVRNIKREQNLGKVPIFN
jgi:hypothetical protein